MSQGPTDTNTDTVKDTYTVTLTVTDTNEDTVTDTAGFQLLSKTFDIFCLGYTLHMKGSIHQKDN